MFMRRVRKNAGFTLVELTVALVILGVLATVSVNAYITMVEKGRWAEAREVLLKCYAGYQRSLDEEVQIKQADVAADRHWGMMGMSDPNAMTGTKFVYSALGGFNGNPRIKAERLPAGSGNTWIISLLTGAVTAAGNAPATF
jgi:prepilin-type N-terminal cleavage/methylation domain-containing protein